MQADFCFNVVVNYVAGCHLSAICTFFSSYVRIFNKCFFLFLALLYHDT